MSLSSDYPRFLEPAWRPMKGGRLARVPAGQHAWLTDTGSLTTRVIGACGGDFRVQLLWQDWGRPLISEAELLGVKSTEQALVREVQLRCNEEPWVFARTVIPASSVRGEARRLTLLGSRPLGAVLFSDPTTRRGLMEMARMDARHRLHRRACQHLSEPPREVWGRRTLFCYRGKPLLVNEIFLPELPVAG